MLCSAHDKKINFYSILEYYCEKLDKNFTRKLEDKELVLDDYAYPSYKDHAECVATLTIEFLCECGDTHELSLKSLRF